MRYRVLVVGKPRCAWSNDAVATYMQRLRGQGGIEETHVKAETFRGDVEAVQKAESARILKSLGPRDQLVVLDERGTSVDTRAFATILEEGQARGRLVFVIGGAYGHHASLRERAWKVLRLSDLILNHEVARVLLHEQIYRGVCVLSGHPYSH